MSRLLPVVAVAGLLALAAAVWLSRPLILAADALPAHVPDLANGERVFWAGGCSSCHASPVNGKRAKGDAKLKLGGGEALDTPFGVFRVPNISVHEDGIGGWSTVEFVNAMQRGVSPDGRHYYPSFPYTSYTRMDVRDVIDLKAYLDTLPPVEGVIGPHELAFPWSVRRGIGFWKRLYLDATPVIAAAADDQVMVRGRALVEGAGHCGECHTPRDRFGGPDASRWLGGAPNPDGKGRIPNITPGGKTLSSWSAADIAYYLETGFTPDFDTVGGSMVAVQENLARLQPEDRAAIAVYLKALPVIQ